MRSGAGDLRQFAQCLRGREFREVAGAEPDAHEDVPEPLGAGEGGEAEVGEGFLDGDLAEVGGAERDVAEDIPEFLGGGERGLADRVGGHDWPSPLRARRRRRLTAAARDIPWLPAEARTASVISSSILTWMSFFTIAMVPDQYPAGEHAFMAKV